MDSHTHIKDVLMDFGPVYAFWPFTFERYNGILGSQSTNNKAIEPQLMNCFLRVIFAFTFDFPSKFYDNFSPVCSYKDLSVGSVHTTVSGNTEPALKLLPHPSGVHLMM